jgi:hypothetical protein
MRVDSKMLRALGGAAALSCSALCGGAAAQTLSDQLQVIVGGTTTTLTAYDATSGMEPILAYANVTGGMDYSSTLTPTFVSGTGASATFNTTGANAWFTHQKTTTTFREAVLTEPGSSTTYSDVMLSFMATVNGASVNAVAMISDPTMVSDIMAIDNALGIVPASTPETGASQNVTSLLFTGTAPFTVNAMSAVPEPGSSLLLVGGLAAFGLLPKRRVR